MICFICGNAMRIRTGPHGYFYYCPHGRHGTISVAKYDAIVRSIPNYGLPIGGKDPLMQAVERTQSALGYGVMTDIERFYIDSPVYDENDFWQDMRPNG